MSSSLLMNPVNSVLQQARDAHTSKASTDAPAAKAAKKSKTRASGPIESVMTSKTGLG